MPREANDAQGVFAAIREQNPMSRFTRRAAAQIVAVSTAAVLASATVAAAATPVAHADKAKTTAATTKAHAARCASAARAHTTVKSCFTPARRPAVKKPAAKKATPAFKKHATPVAAPVVAPVPAPAPVATPAPAPVASTAPCANGDLTPDASNIPVVEASELCLLNQVRGQNGLPALAENADLQSTADAHNNDMVAENYFAHDGPAGDTPESRIQASGYLSNPNASYVIGENIAWGTLNLSTPNATIAAWVASPDHLANILNPSYTDTGMSISSSAPASLSAGQQGAMYTEDFGGVDNS